MAVPIDIQWQEPQVFAIGDTLIFQRSLPDYPASQGWSLQYTVTQLTANGGKQVRVFNSQPQGDLHLINVASFGEEAGQQGLEADDYVLAGFALNATSNNGGPERHRIYYAALSLVPDLDSGAVTKPLWTTAQQMINALKPVLLAIYAHALQETDVQRSRFAWARREEIRKELNFWEERRAYELKVQAQANGQGNLNKMVPAFYTG